MLERVRQLQRWISRTLHVPAGIALVIAIILVPKLIGAGMLLYTLVQLIRLRIRKGEP